MRTRKALAVLLLVAIIIVPGAAAVSSVSSDGAVPFTSYYDQLNANSKAVYDAIDSAGPDVRNITVPLPIKITTNSNNPDDAKTYMDNTIRSISDDAFKALRISSPMAYWAWIANVVKQPVPTFDKNGALISLTYNVAIARLPGDTAGPDVAKMLSDLAAAVDAFSTNSTTIRDKVLDINNYLIEKVTYDPYYGITEATDGGGTESVFDHDAYGALVESHHYAVCDGYAKAFLLLCQKEGIDCVVVLGTAVSSYENHAWNYVKMEDGKWYAIDVTWNDNGKDDNPYFLLGGKTFFTTHSPGAFLGDGSNAYPFKSPALSPDNYDVYTPTIYDLYGGWIVTGIIIAILCAMLYYHQTKTGKR